MSTEPLRHWATDRNRAKALKHAKDLLGQLEFLLAENVKRGADLQYSIGRATRLVNRLHSEAVKLGPEGIKGGKLKFKS